MKNLPILFLTFVLAVNVFSQSNFQKIYDAEKTFEKASVEKGLNQAFIEFTTSDGICYFSGAPENCREYWKKVPASTAFLTWNPTFIDVSSNGAIGYSIGNSVFRPGGKDDKIAYYGEYATIWQRQPDGNYLAVVDIGTSHDEANSETKWTSPTDSGRELNEKKSSAADYSAAFFQIAAKDGLGKAYKNYLAEDARLLREGKMPIIGKTGALAAYKNDKSRVSFAKKNDFQRRS